MPQLEIDPIDKSISVAPAEYDVKNEHGTLYTWYCNAWSNPIDLQQLYNFMLESKTNTINRDSEMLRLAVEEADLIAKYPELYEAKQCLAEMQSLYNNMVDKCTEKEKIVDILKTDANGTGCTGDSCSI